MDSWLHEQIVLNLLIVVDYWTKGDLLRAEEVCRITWGMLAEHEDFVDNDHKQPRRGG